MSHVLRHVAIVILAAFAALSAPAAAQAAEPLPIPQQQFDELVNAISKSVLEKLKTQQAAPAKTAPSEAKRSPFDAGPDEPDELSLFLQKAGKALHAVPALGGYLADFRRALDDSPNGGLGRRTFLLLLAVVAAAVLAAEALVGLASKGLRDRLAAQASPEAGIRSLQYLGLLLLLDALGVFALWAVGRVSLSLWFSGTALQDKFAFAILFALLLWRLYALAFRALLRPGLAPARLCDVGEEGARRLYRLVSLFILFAILLRVTYYVFVAMRATPDAIAAGRLLVAPLVLVALIVVVVRGRDGARQWLTGLGRAAPVVGFIGRHWLKLAIPYFTAAIATQAYGAVTGREGVPSAMILTLNLVMGVLFFETLLQAVVRRLDSQLEGFTPAGSEARLPDVIARCVRVAVLIGVLVVLGESWVVDVLQLVDGGAWEHLTRAGRAAGITMFVAFVVWELFRYATDAYLSRAARANPQDGAGGSPGGAVSSRFDTLIPMLRVTVAIVIVIITSLVVLDDLGVNIGPLLAGASVLGLAISFGSQTLVRDIVSGVFYLADDAFRVGEYIDCGRAKGTVEGFTLRSIRLRHQNGQIHTIPFGSLGQITNFSRDWTAVKFSLPFARETDIEKLRKAAKKIGAEMMEEPEFKADLIAPFKMQGIADITDSAMLVRFKFTAKPGNPSAIQNAAVTRLLRALPELGISLSNPPPAR
jgi:small-conductance mechanosensitive channel